MVISLTQ